MKGIGLFALTLAWWGYLAIVAIGTFVTGRWIVRHLWQWATGVWLVAIEAHQAANDRLEQREGQR